MKPSNGDKIKPHRGGKIRLHRPGRMKLRSAWKMKRRAGVMAVVTSLAAMVVSSPREAQAAKVALVPVSASGTHEIVGIGNEIRLSGAGQQVKLEIQLSNWGPAELRAWQVVIDSSTYASGPGVPLTVPLIPCTEIAECFVTVETGSFCLFPPPPGAGGNCNPGYINRSHPNWVHQNEDSAVLFADVGLATADFLYFAVLNSPTTTPDPGVPRYAGSLLLEIPPGATGTYMVGFIEGEAESTTSLVEGPGGQPILPLTTVPALITIVCGTPGDCDGNCISDELDVARQIDVDHTPLATNALTGGTSDGVTVNDVAQSFVAGTSGRLVEVSLALTLPAGLDDPVYPPGTQLTLEVLPMAATPDASAPLGSISFVSDLIPPSGGPLMVFDMVPARVDLVAGTGYAIFVRSAAGVLGRWKWEAKVPGDIPDGLAWTRQNGNWIGNNADALLQTVVVGSLDCNDNLVPDYCELAEGAADFNVNEILDACERALVDAAATGANDGSSWADAYVSLQDALNAVAGGGPAQIWVAAGTYRPDQGEGITPGDRAASFRLPAGAAVYGGFAGGEGLVAERDPVANPTVLSGEIAALEDLSDNSFHVVTVSGTGAAALLDGFTIERGNADAAGDQGRGGGVSAPKSLTLSNCRLSDNHAATSGGGVYSLAPQLAISRSAFVANSAGDSGGGLFQGGGGVAIADTLFEGNEADAGGAVAVRLSGTVAPVMQSVFLGNVAQTVGGAVLFDQSAPGRVESCTFADNLALGGGDGLYTIGTIRPTMVNSILWGSTDQIAGDVTDGAAVTYSDVQGPALAGPGNISADPLFVNRNAGDLRLGIGSPCIDAGDATAAATTADFDGNPRLYDDTGTSDTGKGSPPMVDMGAFEFFDCNNNGIPDDFEIAHLDIIDCNGNNVLDACEPLDCDGDDIPDDCEPSLAEQDCNGDGVCNGVEIAGCGGDPDCGDCQNGGAGNGIPDLCDIATGTSLDCTAETAVLVGQGIPDECEPDCQNAGAGNGVADSCDVLNGTSADCNNDGIPDECQSGLNCIGAVASGSWSQSATWDSNDIPLNDESVEESAIIGSAPPPGVVLLTQGQTVVNLDIDVTVDTVQVLGDGALNVTAVTPEGDLTLAKPGGLLILGDVFVAQSRTLDASIAQVTIGPGGVYQKAPGATNTSASLLAETLTIASGTPQLPAGTLEMRDSMALTAQNIVLDGRAADPGCNTVVLLGGVSPPPKLAVRDFSLLLVGSLDLRDTAILTVGSTDQAEAPIVTVTDAFRNNSTDPCGFEWLSGELVLSGGTAQAPVSFEVAGRDLGPVPDGFSFVGNAPAVLPFGSSSADGNFSISKIKVDAGSRVAFRDEVPNTSEVIGPCLEALYVGTLTLGANSTTVISGTTVYYAKLDDQGGAVQTVGCGGLVPLSTCETNSDCDDGFFCTGAEVCMATGLPLADFAGICQTSPAPCEAGAVCDEFSAVCVDDECALGTNNCDVNATCMNTPGGFTCTCNAGACYFGDGVLCQLEDLDGDGVCDADDNCPGVANPQQEDCNADGVGDACETPPAVLAEPGGSDRQRFIALVVPSETCTPTALRVTLETLYNPADPQPVNQPDFSGQEGTLRYLNLLRDGNGDPVTQCLSSAGQSTFYACATVGCEPEYADWSALFGAQPLHVTGNAIVPDSTYTVAQLAASCAGNEILCPNVSAEVPFATARYGDSEPNGANAVADVVNTVEVLKQSFGSLFEYHVYIRQENPQPQNDAVSVSDVVFHVDALKLIAYQLPMNGCP